MGILALQKMSNKTNGSRVLNKSSVFIGRSIIQKKLSIGAANDAYEKEADRMADRVVAMRGAQVEKSSNDSIIQRKCANCEEEERIRKKLLADQIKPLIQQKGSGTEGEVPSEKINAEISQTRGSGKPMEASARAVMESGFGADFSQIRVHAGANAIQLSRDLNAQAFTVGNDIYFNEGKYNPNSYSGKHLLAHELTHTIQQGAGEKRIQRLVRTNSVSCSNYPPSSPIFSVMNTSPTGALNILTTADSRAIGLLDNTIAELNRVSNLIRNGAEPGWPTISDCVAQSMQIKLLVNPANRNSWTGTGPRTVNRIIRVYTNLRNVLLNGGARYSCIGSTCQSDEDAYVMVPEPGYHIRLCSRFWNNLGVDDRALVIIHELAHHYYNTNDHGFRGIGASHCLDQFVADVNNLPQRYPGACHNNEVNAC